MLSYSAWHARTMVAALLAAISLQGCASVSVRKVPTPSQYVHWTDDMQKEADAMQGIRFYLPRPFVNVFESFPVRTDIYVANGVVSPDGQYVIIKSIRAESELSRVFVSAEESVSFSRSAISEKKLQALVTEKATPTTTPAATDIHTGVSGVLAPPTPAPASNPPAPSPKTGTNQQKSTNNNGAFAYQPLRGNFDLVYLPDFDEQYCVDSASGLGNAQFEVNLGQGWSLQGFNSLTDNSEINQRIFELIDNAMRLANQAASAALGDFLPTLNNLVAKTTPHLQAAVTPKEQMAERAPGTPVSLKIVVVHYAAKGLYPVIKPRELAERQTQTKVSYGVLDLFKLFPAVEHSSDVDPRAIKQAQQAIDRETGTFTVPRYPYQYVSFNTFRYLAIQVIKPGDDPFKVLYDKTGTQGGPGDARTGEIVNLIKELHQLSTTPVDTTPGGNQQQNPPASQGGSNIEKFKQIKPGLEDPEQTSAPSAKPRFVVKNTQYDAVRNVVTADLAVDPEGSTPAITRDQAKSQLKDLILKRLSNNSVNASDVLWNDAPGGSGKPASGGAGNPGASTPQPTPAKTPVEGQPRVPVEGVTPTPGAGAPAATPDIEPPGGSDPMPLDPAAGHSSIAPIRPPAPFAIPASAVRAPVTPARAAVAATQPAAARPTTRPAAPVAPPPPRPGPPLIQPVMNTQPRAVATAMRPAAVVRPATAPAADPRGSASR